MRPQRVRCGERRADRVHVGDDDPRHLRVLHRRARHVPQQRFRRGADTVLLRLHRGGQLQDDGDRAERGRDLGPVRRGARLVPAQRALHRPPAPGRRPRRLAVEVLRVVPDPNRRHAHVVRDDPGGDKQPVRRDGRAGRSRAPQEQRHQPPVPVRCGHVQRVLLGVLRDGVRAGLLHGVRHVRVRPVRVDHHVLRVRPVRAAGVRVPSTGTRAEHRHR